MSPTQQAVANDAVADRELVRRICGGLARHLPAQVDRDDLISLGSIAVIQARGRFDRARGVTFQAFAKLRIRGAMLDALRDSDPISRAERAHCRATGDPPSVTLVALDDELPATASDAVDLLERKELHAALRDAFAALDARTRQVLELRFWQDRSLLEIAAAHHISESRVCQIVTAAVEQLRARLDPGHVELGPRGRRHAAGS